MKKNIFLILLGLTLAPAALAEKAPSTISAPVVIPPRFEAQPLNVSAKFGLMHTNVGHYGNGDNQTLQNVPSLLYGGTLAANWEFMQKWGYTHSLGLSVGYYSGNERSNYYEGASFLNYHEFLDTDVQVIPLTVSYDLKKDISDALSIYAGVRTGAMIRTTEVDGEYGFGTGNTRVVNDSSTKVLPMLGLGAGIQMYISDKWSINLGYDFVWTFGNDCDRMYAAGSNSYVKETSMDHRYYGTISFGVTRSF